MKPPSTSICESALENVLGDSTFTFQLYNKDSYRCYEKVKII